MCVLCVYGGGRGVKVNDYVCLQIIMSACVRRESTRWPTRV